MLLIASAFGWPLPYVRAATHRKEGAVSFHSPKFAIVETLITESPGEHDVIHALSSAYEGVLWEPGEPNLWISQDHQILIMPRPRAHSALLSSSSRQLGLTRSVGS